MPEYVVNVDIYFDADSPADVDDYLERLKQAIETTGMSDAPQVGLPEEL